MVRGGKAEEGSSTCSLSKDSGGGARTKRGEGERKGTCGEAEAQKKHGRRTAISKTKTKQAS